MKAILISLLTAASASAWAAGPLTPPGPPAPTMKTLDQVEARTPIESLPFTISAPGSYYFTGNLEFTAESGDAITIASDNVTLDLNGFTLSSTSGVTGTAIMVNDDLTNIAIQKGNIAGNTTVTVGPSPDRTFSVVTGGFSYGIRAEVSGELRNLNVDQIQVEGCRIDGILAYNGNVTNCTASFSGATGIFCAVGNVTNCIAQLNYGEGIACSTSNVGNCLAFSNGKDGITIDSGTVEHCTANLNGTVGIDATFSASVIVTGCAANSNRFVGISARDGIVTSCTATQNGSAGIYAQSGTVTGCASINNGVGISAEFGSVTNCTVSGNRHDGIVATFGSVTNSVTRSNNTTSTAGQFDLKATNAVIAFTKYGTGDTTGSTLTGNDNP